MRAVLLVLLGTAALAWGLSCTGCSGNGACNASGKCTCSAGYSGFDCSERTCPSGASWVNVDAVTSETAHGAEECSGAGHCNRKSGKCTCRDGFSGHACERMTCTENIFGVCSGHGRCISMAELAVFQDDDSAFVSTTYGGVWDAHKIYGCLCDDNFSGPHCDDRKCPSGDDVLTTGQVDETQEIYCQCPGTCSGTFRLKFRGKVTGAIAWDATIGTITTALQKIKSIRKVTVTMALSATAACSVGGTSTLVAFNTESGDVPAMTIVRSTVASTGTLVHLVGSGGTDVGGGALSVTGTKENAPCNNRGFCGLGGICKCEEHFSSSNGEGGVGATGDCGYGF